MTRREKLLGGIDLRLACGLEIGALCWPVLTRKDCDIRYLDHLSTESLKRKYAADPQVDVGRIVAVDYVCDGITLAEALGAENRFDFVVASHVIEHVPDVIGWLNGIRNALKPGGRLCLAIPDMRRTFDRFRQPTGVAALIEDHLLRRTRPSPRAVFDHIGHHAAMAAGWTYPLAEAFGLARDALEHYHDVHCLAASPESFLHLLDDLFRLDLLAYRIAALHGTEAGENEFFVQLERLDGAPAEIREAAMASLRDVYAAAGYSSLREDPLYPMRESRRLADELARLRNSRSWRLTKPLRHVGAWFRSIAKKIA